MKIHTIFCCALLFTLMAISAFGQDNARHVEFGQFAASLPPQWDGDEQTGFISDSADEYLLTLGRKDEKGDKFVAQISIYLLPNKPGVTSEEAARTLTEAQGNATTPVQTGIFWQFTGEPRSRTLKGMATTMVRTTPENMLIIIAQDPDNLGASGIVDSLSGLTPLSRAMLGR